MSRSTLAFTRPVAMSERSEASEDESEKPRGAFSGAMRLATRRVRFRLRPGSASDALFVARSRRGCGTVCTAGVRCEERDEVACTVVTADRLHECVSLLQAEA